MFMHHIQKITNSNSPLVPYILQPRDERGVSRPAGHEVAGGDINNPPCYSYANAHGTIISGTRITRRYTDWKNSLTAASLHTEGFLWAKEPGLMSKAIANKNNYKTIYVWSLSRLKHSYFMIWHASPVVKSMSVLSLLNAIPDNFIDWNININNDKQPYFC